MLNVFLNAVLPIFSVVAIGFAFGKRGVFGADLAMQLNRFVFYFAMPVLLFRLLAGTNISQFEWAVVLAYFLAELGLYVLGYFIARHLFRRSPMESLLLGMTTGFVNHVMFVLPIAQQLFGVEAAGPIIAIITLDVVVFFGATIVILETAQSKIQGISKGNLLTKFSTNPQLLSIAFGALAMVLGLKLGGGAALFAQFVGDAAAPASLFALGIILSVQKVENFRAAVVFSAIKLLAMPVVCWALLAWVFPGSAEWTNPALLVAAGPTGAMAFVLALQYKVEATTIAYIILLTTIGSVVSISIMGNLI